MIKNILGTFFLSLFGIFFVWYEVLWWILRILILSFIETVFSNCFAQFYRLFMDFETVITPPF